MIVWGSIVLLAGRRGGGGEGEGGEMGLVIAMKIEGVKGRQSRIQEERKRRGEGGGVTTGFH